MVKTTVGSTESSYSEATNETEVMNTMNSNGSDNSTFQFTVEKLNGKNFLEWAQSVKLVIDGKGKL